MAKNRNRNSRTPRPTPPPAIQAGALEVTRAFTDRAGRQWAVGETVVPGDITQAEAAYLLRRQALAGSLPEEPEAPAPPVPDEPAETPDETVTAPEGGEEAPDA